MVITMSDFNISVASYSFNKLITSNQLDVYGYLDLLKYRYHVDYADIWSDATQKSTLSSRDMDYVKRVRYALDQRGMKLANLCVDGPYVWCNDEKERADHKRTMLEYLNIARELDAKTIRIDFGCNGTIMDGFRNPTKDMPDEAFKYITETYKEYCAIVSEWGAKIGPENHWGWDRIPEYLVAVCKEVDHPSYGHLYHLRNFFDEVEMGEEYAISHAMHTHIHADSIPYAKDIIRRLAKSGYTGTYGVEHHSGKYETERVEWHVGSLRALIAEVRNESLEETSVNSYMTNVYSGKRGFGPFDPTATVIGR